VKISNETKVGVISIVSLIALILGFNFLKGKKIWSDDTLLTARYGNIEGLQTSNPVMINGMQVGAVSKINTDKDMRKILVDLNITKDIHIPENSIAVIKTNPLGTPSIEILLGTATSFLKNKDSIGTNVSTGLLDGVMDKVDPVLIGVKKAVNSADSLLNNFNSVLDPSAKSNIAAMLANLNKVTASMMASTASLNILLNAQTGALSKSLNNVSGITGNFAGNNDKINSVVENLDKATAKFANLNLQKTLDTMDVAINNLKTLLANISNSKGTLGMLMNDPTLYRNLASTGNKLNLLLDDVRMNPKRYINISLFGKKKTGEVLLTPLPDTLNSPYYVEKVK
jgi:phospholipid/cholesterol/gamma-HCH transport system substrate-binding protein